MSDVLTLAKELIARPSITPDDAGCQQLIATRLAALGFELEPMPFGKVENLWARRGREKPLFVFAGHTDVVPPGPPGEWRTPPFDPVIRDGYLYGRGAADMKGSLAAMVVACERFLARHPHHGGSLAFLLTSDEEGPSVDGTMRVVEALERRGEKIDWCIVGEPSSEHAVGDTLRIGRRGSLTGQLRVHGIQGHVAYPERARNPIHAILPALAELATMQWDAGDDHFPPTSFQISNFNAGTGAANVIPGEATIIFNFRYPPGVTAEILMGRVQEVLTRHGASHDIAWQHSGRPFLTQQGRLLEAACQAIREVTGKEPVLSTGGGTSDGRFIAPTGAEVIELGPVNATIHQIDERVGLAELDVLATLYERILQDLLGAVEK